MINFIKVMNKKYMKIQIMRFYNFIHRNSVLNFRWNQPNTKDNKVFIPSTSCINNPTSSAVSFCIHSLPFLTGLYNTSYYSWFYWVSYTILAKILIENLLGKRLRCKNILITGSVNKSQWKFLYLLARSLGCKYTCWTS